MSQGGAQERPFGQTRPYLSRVERFWGLWFLVFRYSFVSSTFLFAFLFCCFIFRLFTIWRGVHTTNDRDLILFQKGWWDKCEIYAIFGGNRCVQSKTRTSMRLAQIPTTLFSFFPLLRLSIMQHLFLVSFYFSHWIVLLSLTYLLEWFPLCPGSPLMARYVSEQHLFMLWRRRPCGSMAVNQLRTLHQWMKNRGNWRNRGCKILVWF